MIETAENLPRREYGISREDQDALAARSQERALKAIADGRFDDELPSRCPYADAKARP